MSNVNEISKIKESIEWIRNNPYTEEIISISPVESVIEPEEIIISESQQDYPVEVRFTAMQRCVVKYRNKYYGIKEDTIVAGADAVRYKYATTPLYQGPVLADRVDYSLISVEFIGEETKVISSTSTSAEPVNNLWN